MPGSNKRVHPENPSLDSLSDCKRIQSNPPSPSVMTIAVDEDLYSRQLGAYGMETMGKLIKMRVLVMGMNGTGVEVVKNLALAGPQSVIIADDSIVETQHLGANCFLRSEHVGRVRAQAVLPGLTELNDYVNLSCVPQSEVTASFISSNIDCVVVCGRILGSKELNSINDACRAAALARGQSVPFITASACGLTASVFSDFGEDHTVIDADGENEKTCFITQIGRDEDKLTVHLVEDKRCPLDVGDHVTFSEIVGMSELNGHAPMKVVGTSKFSFEVLADGSDLGAYIRGGLVKQVKMSQKVSFQSLQSAIVDPIPDGCFVTPDFSCFDRPVQLHLAFMAVDRFFDEYQRLPKIRNSAEADRIVDFAKAILSENKGSSWAPADIQEDVVRWVSYFAQLEISPLASFAGGVAAQEVVKTTGKFMPLKQFLHLDYFHMFKELPGPATEEELVDDRYRDMRLIFGNLFEKFQNATLFLVGAGALGCELLKMFSLMGMCCGKGGKLTVTDMDTIENSNLNRQFLFRKRHIGKMKSNVAASSAHEMNNDLNIAPTQTRVGKESEDFFDDRFWLNLDCVVNALDNVASRLYVDSRCVWFNKPLLESGTLGTKCNSQVVMPRLTESYGDSQDPAEDSIPLCTLKNFPYLIDHCLQWSRDTFQGIFSDVADDLILAIKSFSEYSTKLKAEGFPKMQIERTRSAMSLQEFAAAPSPETALQLSLNLFMQFHNYPLNQLIYNYPQDHVTEEGSRFWSGTKRFPKALDFDHQDALTTLFICSASRIYANIVSYDGLSSMSDYQLMKIAANLSAPEFEPDATVVIQVEENEGGNGAENDSGLITEAEVDRILVELKTRLDATKDSIRVEPEVFEKDDDTNHHIDFVHACGNMRARNYSINECARHESKLIAGKIIPALATTTAMVTGLVSMELLKVFQENTTIEHFRNSFINMSMPVWIMSEPMPPKKNVDCDFDPVVGGPVIARPSGFTSWDKVELTKEGCTPKDLIDFLEQEYNVETSVISSGSKMLYMGFVAAHKSRLNRPLVELLAEAYGIPTVDKPHSIALETACNDIKTGDDVVIPTVQLRIQ
eukprot:GHVH01001531.1.p1 GENE.GHVH01001531.1~~GHVH01001531.1.p1  ORF type:complete len:1077 (+),score=148.69 GHVH01001531.1:62-3292(+)